MSQAITDPYNKLYSFPKRPLPVGTYVYYDYYINVLLSEIKPASLSNEVIKPRLAIHWLRSEKPKSLFSRMAWWARVLKELYLTT